MSDNNGTIHDDDEKPTWYRILLYWVILLACTLIMTILIAFGCQIAKKIRERPRFRMIPDLISFRQSFAKRFRDRNQSLSIPVPEIVGPDVE